MGDPTLMEMLKEVRWKTLKLLENVDDGQARFAPAGTSNTILWHAGHSLVVVEHLGVKTAGGGPPPYPADWAEKFDWNSKPAAVTEWPALADIVTQLKDQRTRLTGLIEAMSAEQLDRVVGDPPRSRTVRGVILHGLHDEAGHQGEMYLLKKLWKLRQ
jgi:hypothetical protein